MAARLPEPIRIPNGALVVLAGPSGAGKSTWAAANFRVDQVIDTDDLRALVGTGPNDQRAGTDAFDVLQVILERRLRRGLVTVVDSLGLDPELRNLWYRIAEEQRRPVMAIVFDTAERECRKRNRQRSRPVPAKALTGQLRRWPEQRALIESEVPVASPAPVRIIPTALVPSPHGAHAQRKDPIDMRFGLSISSFDFGETVDLADRLAELAAEAEAAGFSDLWVMDHFIQIPQVGREWDPMLDSYTTLAYLAGRTTSIGLGTLVTGITYRNPAHLAKIVASLDVLSGGRARCGLGAAWFEREHALYGYRFPPDGERLELLEDALRLLPLMWGPGSPPFEGHHFATPAATCYPRPLQEHIPMLVGGSGERRTLRLVAEQADACNLFGEPDVVAHKVEVLHRHCEEVGRDPAELLVTQLSPVLCAADPDDLARRLEAVGPAGAPAEAVAEHRMAGTVEDHTGRFRLLADAGVQQIIVSLADLAVPGAISNFAPVIGSFARTPGS